MKKIENSECLNEFGSYIKEARQWRKLTQAEMAEALDITQGYYSLIENGERDVDLVLAMKICKELRLDMRGFIKQYL